MFASKINQLKEGGVALIIINIINLKKKARHEALSKLMNKAMSEKSFCPNLIVEHEGKILYDSSTTSEQCNSVSSVKRYIEKHFKMPVGSQMLSFENVLLADNIAPEDLSFKIKSALNDANSHGTDKLNRPIQL